jgi:hypothetical protein
MHKKITMLAGVAIYLAAVFPVAGCAEADTRGPLGEAEISALVRQAPNEEDMKDAEALVLFDGTYITHEDGMVSVRRQRLVKIYTEYAIDELGDPRLAFDGSRQDLEIHASRTYLPDGSTMDTPENGYNEVTPFGLDRSMEHLDIREMVVSHVGIVRDASILLDWTVSDTAPAGLPFNRVLMLQDEFRTLEKEVVAEGDLFGESVNPSGSGLRLAAPDRAGGRLAWHMSDVPKRPLHAHSRLGDQTPWIAVAAAPTWEDLLGVLGGKAATASFSTHHVESVLKDMEDEAPFIGEREALERIVEAIGDRTHLVRYRPWLFTPQPRPADASILRSTATPVDRCVLMLAACKARDLDAYLMLPARWRNLTEGVPALEALGDPLVRVVGSEGTWFVDPVRGAVTVREPIEGGLPYFVADGGPVEEGLMKMRRETAPVRASDIRLSVFWDLGTGEAKGDGSIEGPAVFGLAWEEPGQLLRDWAEGWTDSAEAGDVRVLASGPEAITFALSLDAPLPSPDDRGRILLELPMPLCDMGDLLPPALNPAHSETDGVLFPPAPASVRLAWQIRLPEGYTLLPGREREIKLEGGSLSVKRTVDADLIELGYHFEWDGRPVLPGAYAKYRELILDVSDGRLTRLVLAEEEEPEE